MLIRIAYNRKKGKYAGRPQEFTLAFAICYIPPIILVLYGAKVVGMVLLGLNGFEGYEIQQQISFIGFDCVINAIVITISVEIYRRRYRKTHHLYTLSQAELDSIQHN